MKKDAMLHSLAQVSYYSERIQRNRNGSMRAYSRIFWSDRNEGTRREFQRMLKEYRERKIDLILVKSISRFARNTLALLNTVRELKGLGIGVYFEEQKLYPRCKMVAQAAEEAASPISPETAGEDYLILYPVYPPLCFS